MHRLRFVIFFAAASLWSYEEDLADLFFGDNPIPWMTGPLLTPTAHVVNPGAIKFQPYSQTRVITGHYNSHWSVESHENFYEEQLRVVLKFGLCNRLDFQIDPRMLYNETEHRHSINVADFPLFLNIQVIAPKGLGDGPALKFSLAARVPIGKYDHLRPSLLRTDITGTGCWFPGFVVAGSNLWHISRRHYLELRFATRYYFGVPVHIKGYNLYGGNFSTNGSVIPGNYYDFQMALEYSLTQNWVLACDFLYEHKDKDRFSGESSVHVGHHSEESVSLAPAVEYNWARHMGVIAGVWFSIAGRNRGQFITGMVSFDTVF